MIFPNPIAFNRQFRLSYIPKLLNLDSLIIHHSTFSNIIAMKQQLKQSVQNKFEHLRNKINSSLFSWVCLYIDDSCLRISKLISSGVADAPSICWSPQGKKLRAAEIPKLGFKAVAQQDEGNCHSSHPIQHYPSTGKATTRHPKNHQIKSWWITQIPARTNASL